MKKEKTLKEELLENVAVGTRVDRREVKKEDPKSEGTKDRRSGNDRRNNNLIGGRRKTDLTEEEAKEFEKIISGGDGQETLRRLEDRNYRSLNDEAKKIEIKKTIGIHRLNIKRLVTLVTLVFIAAALISTIYYFVDKSVRRINIEQNQVKQIKQELDRTLQNKVDNAALENIENKFNKENKK